MKYLFRCWHEYGESVRPAKAGMIYDEKPGDCLLWKNKGQKVISVMQSINKKDINKRLIYEKDIVTGYAIQGGPWKILFKGVIQWDYDECCYFVNNDDVTCCCWPYISFRFIKEIKVIGNIYEGEIYK